MEVNHFSHIHPLRLIDPLPCNACYKLSEEDEIYGCESCDFKLHKRCSELPIKFLNPYHPHPLTLHTEPLDQDTDARCNACFGRVKQGFFYCCQHCNLNLDISCAFLKPTRGELQRPLLHHFSHFHPVELYDITIVSDSYGACALCEKFTSGSTYRCCHCNFYIHQACAEMELPREIQTLGHPCYLTLGLKPIMFQSFGVSQADKVRPGLCYYCENCKFQEDVLSSLKHLDIEMFNSKKLLAHFSHRHLLKLEEPKSGDGQFNCFACGKSGSGPTYGCLTKCQFFLHQSCTEFPLEIRHFYHRCPLTLRIRPNSFNCGACDRTIQGFYFYCKWCNFGMDIECALLPTKRNPSEEQFCHSSHGHPLTSTETKDGDGATCSCCSKLCSGPAFVCRRCSFIIDKTCFELPQETQYAFHSGHPLTLLGTPTKLESLCSVCCKYLSGFTYHCELCDFETHKECTQIMPTVSYEGHNHLLLFLEDIDTAVKCNNCDTPCDSSVFHCVECDFNLHFLCGPLPCTIKHECHYDPLVLTDSPLSYESDEFYCDACKKERDPRLPIYYCKKCLFPAEIKCVMSEVVLTLKGHYGDVELRTPVGQIYGKVISKSLEVKELEPEEEKNCNKKAEEKVNKPVLTWDDMLSSFNEDENIELRGVLAGPGNDINVAGETSSNYNSEDSDVSLVSCSDSLISFSDDQNAEAHDVLSATGRDGKLKVSLFSDKAYKHLMEKLDSSANYSSLTLWEGNEDVVNVRGNLIAKKLAPILHELCAKYGDISAESTLSPRVKNYFTVMLCGTMHSMCNTRIIDISENILLNWWKNLKILKFAGFKVQFAFDHLEKVVHVYFGLQVENVVAELDRKMKNLSALIEQSTKEIEELKEKRECIALAEASKCSIIKDCLTEAFESSITKSMSVTLLFISSLYIYDFIT